MPPSVLARIRGAAATAAALVVAILLEGWARVMILRRFRNDEPRRIAGMNRIIRRWGRWTFWCGRYGLGFRVIVQGRPRPKDAT